MFSSRGYSITALMASLSLPIKPCMVRGMHKPVRFILLLTTVFNLSKYNCSHPNIYLWIRAFSFLSIWLTSTHFLCPSSDVTPFRNTFWSLPCPNAAKFRGPSCMFPQQPAVYHNAQNTHHNFWRLLFYLSAIISTSGKEACLLALYPQYPFSTISGMQ